MTFKRILTLLTILVVHIACSQEHNYDFIPKKLLFLSDQKVSETQIVIAPDVILFSENGKHLPISQMQLMANPEFKPLFFTNSSKEIKAIIFQKKNNHPLQIKNSLEEEYLEEEKALDFIAYKLDGNPIKLSNYKGKIVVLNFWFTKCLPCIKEIPQLNELVNDFTNKDVIFLALTFDKKEVLNSFLKTNTFKYDILTNANDVITMYDIQTYPTSIIINQERDIVFKELGFHVNIKDVLAKKINALL